MKFFYRLDFLQSVQFSSVAKSTCISAEDQTPRDDTTPSNGEAPVLELWGIWSTPLLSLHPGLLCPGVLIPGRGLSIGEIELFNH